jgi:hypothetical protein
MEFQNVSHEDLIISTAEQAQLAFESLLIKIDQLPEVQKETSLQSMAWQAAGSGLWDNLIGVYGEDAAWSLIPELERPNWASQFAHGGSCEIACQLAGSITDPDLQDRAYLGIAYETAKRADIDLTMQLLQSVDGYVQTYNYRQAALSYLALATAERADWESVDTILADTTLHSGTLINLAERAAKQSRYERFATYLNRSFEQHKFDNGVAYDPRLHQNWLEQITTEVVSRAYHNREFGFIEQLDRVINWPDSVSEAWPSWVMNGVLNAASDDHDYESGIHLLIENEMHDIQKVPTLEKVSEALGLRDWRNIERLAADVPLEMVVMMHHLAYAEGALESAQKLNVIVKNHGDNRGDEFFYVKDDIPKMLEQAQYGDWTTSQEYAGSKYVSTPYRERIVQSLVEIAVSQKNYDAVYGLVGDDIFNTRLSFAHNTLENAGDFEGANALVSTWSSLHPGEARKGTSPRLLLTMYAHTLASSVKQEDWSRILETLDRMDVVSKEADITHNGYESAATAILQKLCTTTNSMLLSS